MRIKNDAYYTPIYLIQHLLNNVNIYGRVMEPCAGDGRIAEFIRKARPYTTVTTNDIAAPGHPYKFDATTAGFWQIALNLGVDWTITNPPYNQAFPIVSGAYEASRGGIAMLLRLSWLEPCKDRASWLQDHADYLSNIIIFNPRPSFTQTKKSKTDNVTSAWMVWKKDKVSTKVTFVTDWKKPMAQYQHVFDMMNKNVL